jgi:hypothetical protein
MGFLKNNIDLPNHLVWLGNIVTKNKKFWIKLGNIETKLVSDKLEGISIDKPVFICGLARSGTTSKLIEITANKYFTSHRYEDFPFLFTPFWWNTILKFIPRKINAAKERSHGDGILVTPQSPEAFEEMIWMAFFDNLHSSKHCTVLDENTSNVAFEKFYTDHIKKLILVRGAKRYVAKNNYNITRLAYLKKIFPDAEFIICRRDKEPHVNSLMRMHSRFCEAAKINPKIIDHMSQAGHFEFGPHRIPINTGNHEKVDQILSLWEQGKEREGWDMYWEEMNNWIEINLHKINQL